MGGEDPIGNTVKGIVDTGIKIVADPVSWGSRRLGLKGVADTVDKAKDFSIAVNDKLVDEATGKAGKERDKAKAAKNAADAASNDRARADAEKRAKDAADASFNASEKERMSAGKGARTLLTGPAGLEDSSDEENYSLSRRTLTGV